MVQVAALATTGHVAELEGDNTCSYACCALRPSLFGPHNLLGWHATALVGVLVITQPVTNDISAFSILHITLLMLPQS